VCRISDEPTCMRRIGKLARVCFDNARRDHAATGPHERAMENAAIHVDRASCTFIVFDDYPIRFAAKRSGCCAARYM